MNSLVILDRLEAHAARQGDQVAVREVGPGCDASLTYAQLNTRVQNAASLLKTKLASGEVAILLTGNRVEYFIAALAVWTAGGALMPVHTSIADAELTTIIQRTKARLALTDRRCAREYPTGIEHVHIDTLGLAQGPESPERTGSPSAALLLQSSGTTGLPKIAMRPASAIDAVARNVAEASKLSPNDRVFAAIPICHAYGIENGFLASVWAGATVHLCDGLDMPVALSQLAGQATVFPGVPFMFEVLSKINMNTGQAPSLRLAYSAGAPLPIQLSQGFAERFGVGIGQLYGASELGSVTF